MVWPRAAKADKNAGESLTAESIVSNDVTAIDAVTGDAANMAADVDLNYGNLEMNGTAPVTNGPAKATRPSAGKPEPATENTSAVPANTATNAD